METLIDLDEACGIINDYFGRLNEKYNIYDVDYTDTIFSYVENDNIIVDFDKININILEEFEKWCEEYLKYFIEILSQIELPINIEIYFTRNYIDDLHTYKIVNTKNGWQIFEK